MAGPLQEAGEGGHALVSETGHSEIPSTNGSSGAEPLITLDYTLNRETVYVKPPGLNRDNGVQWRMGKAIPEEVRVSTGFWCRFRQPPSASLADTHLRIRQWPRFFPAVAIPVTAG
jgi:hypothetical protein